MLVSNPSYLFLEPAVCQQGVFLCYSLPLRGECDRADSVPCTHGSAALGELASCITGGMDVLAGPCGLRKLYCQNEFIQNQEMLISLQIPLPTSHLTGNIVSKECHLVPLILASNWSNPLEKKFILTRESGLPHGFKHLQALSWVYLLPTCA